MLASREHLDLDLNLLTALHALLQEQNVTRAADRAGMSQPAMSRSLARLRRLLKDDILVRIGNTLHPTPYAANLIGPVRDLMEQIDRLAEYRPQFDPETAQRQFTIAATDYALLMLLGPLARVFETEARHVKLQVVNLQAGGFDGLQHGDLDVVIGPPPAGDHFQTQELMHDRFMCASWAGSEISEDGITMEQFAKNGHWICKPDGYCLTAAERKGVSLGLGSSPSVTMSEGTAMLPFLIAGTNYVTLIPEGIGNRFGRFAGLRMFEPPFPVEPLTLTMSWHPRSSGDPAHIWLRDHLSKIACHALECSVGRVSLQEA